MYSWEHTCFSDIVARAAGIQHVYLTKVGWVLTGGAKRPSAWDSSPQRNLLKN